MTIRQLVLIAHCIVRILYNETPRAPRPEIRLATWFALTSYNSRSEHSAGSKMGLFP